MKDGCKICKMKIGGICGRNVKSGLSLGVCEKPIDNGKCSPKGSGWENPFGDQLAHNSTFKNSGRTVEHRGNERLD